MTRLHMIDIPPESHGGFNVVGREALSICSYKEVEGELKALHKLLGVSANPPTVDMEDSEWESVISDLITCLGALLETDSVKQWARTTTDRERGAVAYQIHRALKAVRHAARCVDNTGPATGLLMPISLARRVKVLLGLGVLPVAWVRNLDLLGFDAGAGR